MKFIKLYELYKKKDVEIDTLKKEDSEDFDPFSHLKNIKKIDFYDKKEKFLHISTLNSKLKFPFFSLPSGYTCPFAANCKTLTNRYGEKFKSGLVIQDIGQFRCYSASAEARYPKVRDNRWENFEMLRACKNIDDMSALIVNSIKYYKVHKGNFLLFRIHEAGDFYSQMYFDAWLKVCREYPDVKFYAYTKSLPFWVARLNSIPSNLKLIASKGGKDDFLIEKYNLRYADVVNTVEEARAKKLRIDVDDSLAYSSDENFTLLLHGGQGEKTGLGKQSYKNADILRNAKKKI